MYKYVSKTKYRFGICNSIVDHSCSSIEIYFFECSFQVSFFLDSRIQEASLQSRVDFRNNAMKASAPRKRKDTSFDPKLIGGSTNVLEDGGGGGVVVQPLLTNLSTVMISVRKAGLGATLKLAQNDPFRVISPTKRGGGGGGASATLPLKSPMKLVTNVCVENFPLRGVQKLFIYLIGRLRHVVSELTPQAIV